MITAAQEARTTVERVRRRGRWLTSVAGVILVVCGVWGFGIAVAYGRHLLYIARGGFVTLIGTSWPAFDLRALTFFTAIAWLLVGLAVSTRGGRRVWVAMPAALLLAVASVRWQALDTGLRPIGPGLSGDGSDSDSATSIVSAAVLLVVGVGALSSVVLTSGLLAHRWRLVALSALLLGATTFGLMQTLSLDDITPGTAIAMAALSLGEPIMTAVLGVVLIAGARGTRTTSPDRPA